MTKILFLDDERNPIDVTWVSFPEDAEITVVRSYNEFLSCLNFSETPYDIWSLDHDLGCNEFQQPVHSGYDALKAAVRWHEHLLPKQVIAHSKNPIGAENINKYWENYVSNRDRRAL